jgi:hypothetical protein
MKSNTKREWSCDVDMRRHKSSCISAYRFSFSLQRFLQLRRRLCRLKSRVRWFRSIPTVPYSYKPRSHPQGTRFYAGDPNHSRFVNMRYRSSYLSFFKYRFAYHNDRAVLRHSPRTLEHSSSWIRISLATRLCGRGFFFLCVVLYR